MFLIAKRDGDPVLIHPKPAKAWGGFFWFFLLTGNEDISAA
jgi:hypothetical protein